MLDQEIKAGGRGKRGYTSCSCSIALWSSPAVIARLARVGGGGGGMEFDEEMPLADAVGGDPVMPESRIDERRFGAPDGEAEGDSEGILEKGGI